MDVRMYVWRLLLWLPVSTSLVSARRNGFTQTEYPPTDDKNIARNLTVLVGSNFTLKCENGPLSSYSKQTLWYHNGTKMKRRDYTWKIRKSAVRFTSVTLQNAGKYTCIVPLPHVEWERTFNLIVNAPARILTGPNDTQVNWGSNLTLKCNVSGLPYPDVHWLKNNQPVRDKRTELVYKGLTLTVNVTEKANYSCLAENTVITGRVRDKRTALISFKESTKPLGSCSSYVSSACASHLPHVTSLYFDSQTNETKSELLAKDLLRNLLSFSIGNKCLSLGQQLVCKSVFQSCDLTSKVPQPKPLCRETCLKIKNTCDVNWWELQNLHQSVRITEQVLWWAKLSDCKNLPTQDSGPCDDNIVYMAETATPQISHNVTPKDVCYEDKGVSYKGSVNHTVDGYTCQAWTAQTPHTHTYRPENFHSLQGAGNACRNPGGHRDQPWCFTTDTEKPWQYCAIPKCSSSKDNTSVEEQPEFTLGYITLIPIAAIFLLILVILVVILSCRLKRKKSRSRDYLVTPMHDFDFGIHKLPSNACYHQRLSSVSGSVKLEKFEYPRNDIVFLQDIGEGAFGRVFKAQGPRLVKNDDSAVVVVKILREDATSQMKEDFTKEADLLCELDHPNLIKLLAVCTIGKPMCSIVEYMKHGELRQFLRERSPENCMIRRSLFNNNNKDLNPIPKLTSQQQLQIACQIASGVLYLSEKGYVHRDLATRNCLVGDNMTVKIGDFRLMQHLGGGNVFRADEEEPIPIRWLPLETILFNQFTHESDVWSFGVVMWEIFSYAMQPYFGQDHQEVIEYLKSGQVLHCPENTPQQAYELMTQCWYQAPESRPPIQTIHKSLCSLEGFLSKRKV